MPAPVPATETAKIVLDKLSAPLQEAIQLFSNWDFKAMNSEQWQLVGVHYGAYYGMRIGLAMIILFLALTIASWVASTVKSSLARMRFDPTLSKFLAKLARWSVLLTAAIGCFTTFGGDVTAFAAILGAAGFAVGLAFQGTLSNFASGAMLLIFRPFKVGDVINVAGQLGKVDEIELFTTTIDTFDNRRIILPNNSVFGSTIENITYHAKRRVDVSVGTAYDADIDQTRRTLEAAAAQTEGALTDPEPAVVLDALGASSIDWVVRVWAPTSDYSAVKQSLLRSVKIHLDQVGIGIPYPQMDLHIQPANDDAASKAA